MDVASLTVRGNAKTWKYIADHLDLSKVIRESIKYVPANAYAFGVLGLAAVLMVAFGLHADIRLFLFGIPILLGMMTLLLLFSWLVKLDNKYYKAPLRVLVWAIVLFVIAWLAIFTSAATYGHPLFLANLIWPTNKDWPPPSKKPPTHYAWTHAPEFTQVFEWTTPNGDPGGRNQVSGKTLDLRTIPKLNQFAHDDHKEPQPDDIRIYATKRDCRPAAGSQGNPCAFATKHNETISPDHLSVSASVENDSWPVINTVTVYVEQYRPAPSEAK